MAIAFDKRKEGVYFLVIGVLSIAIPTSMAIVLFTNPIFDSNKAFIEKLPIIQAVLNALMFVLISIGGVLIKFKRTLLHRRVMLICFWLITLFFISHIIYYLHRDLTFFADINGDKVISTEEKLQVGEKRLFHFILYVTHLLAGVFLVPLILLTFYFSLSNQLIRHKRTVRWTVPLWLYVSGSYVILYWLIQPYIL